MGLNGQYLLYQTLIFSMPLTGFDLPISAVGSNPSTLCATIGVLKAHIFLAKCKARFFVQMVLYVVTSLLCHNCNQHQQQHQNGLHQKVHLLLVHNIWIHLRASSICQKVIWKVPIHASFSFVFKHIVQKKLQLTWIFSVCGWGIWTWIFSVEDKHSDHLNTSIAQLLSHL